MAQYNKSFNFKNGLQVDYDSLFVNKSGLVGIGLTIPAAHLDVNGSTIVRGNVTATNYLNVGAGASVVGLSTFKDYLHIGAGVSAVGVITASKYYGDGSYLSNIVGFATTRFIVHDATGGPVNSGLATGRGVDHLTGLPWTTVVAIGTNLADAQYDLLIGHDPENTQYEVAPTVYGGIGFVANQGSLKATGIITAVSGFVGPGTSLTGLDGSAIGVGTISNARFPVIDNSKFPLTTRIGVGATTGISTGTVEAKYLNLDSTVGIATAYAFVGLHTGNVTGNVTGNADTATTLNADSSVNTTGIITALGGFVGTAGSFSSGVGIGTTATPAGSLQVQSGLANVDVFVTSENNESTVAIGKSSVITDNNAAIRFNNSTAGWWGTARPNTLDIINYSQGNINFITNPQQVSGATSEGTFTWRRGANVEPSMVYDPQNGRLSIGSTKPEYPLDVTGISTFRSNVFVTGTIAATSMTLENSLTANVQGSLSSVDGSKLFIDKGTDAGVGALVKINTHVTSGLSTFVDVHVTSGGIGINTDPNAPDGENNNHLLTLNSKKFNFNQFIVDTQGRVGVQTDQFYDNVGLAVPTTFAYARAVGVGRTPASAADFGVAGNAPSGWKDEDELIQTRFMIPPTVTQTQRGLLRNNENGTTLPNGSLIYNSTKKQLQMYQDGWVGIGTTDAAA